MAYGPQWGQTDKYGRPKCKIRTKANGGSKKYNKKYSTDSSK